MKKIGCKCQLQLRCGAVRKNLPVTAPYCEESEGRSESEKNADGESAPSDSKEGEAEQRSSSARERGEVKTQQDCCEPVCRGELRLFLCDWE